MGFFDIFKNKKKPQEKTNAEVLNKELNDGLAKTRKGFMEKVFGAISGKTIDDDMYDELEEALIQGDVGVNTSLDLVERLREREKRDKLKTSLDLQQAFADELVELLGEDETPLELKEGELNIILFVGVNGVGKTTSIGKIAYQLKESGHKVILGAADTFRAAAADQLKIWGERVGCDVVAHQEGADPAAVVFDAIAAAKSRNCDVLLVDTAGRLQNKVNLMNELAKIRKVIDREAPDSLRDVLLVLDATTGQNALNQAKVFKETAGVTGVILTKLDGTAKGGVVIGIKAEYDLPIKYIGVGEQKEHLQVFNPRTFAEALFMDLETEESKAAEELDNDDVELDNNEDAEE